MATSEEQREKTGEVLPVKVLVLGEPACGKTALTQAFVRGRHVVHAYQPTTGLDFASKTVFLPDAQVYLHVWDFSGARQYQTLLRPYAQTCFAVVLVYDITDEHSFDALERWLALAQQHATAHQPKVLLVGMKSDLTSKRQVSRECAKLKALCLGAELFEVDVSNRHSVQLPFDHLAQLALNVCDRPPRDAEQTQGSRAPKTTQHGPEAPEAANGWLPWMCDGVAGVFKSATAVISACIMPTWLCSSSTPSADSADDDGCRAYAEARQSQHMELRALGAR